MHDPANNATSGAVPTAPAGRLRRYYDTVTSLKFAMIVVLVIAVACILGTVLPQGRQVEEYLAANPGAAGRMRVLQALGLTHVFTAWWFIGLVGFLAISLAICTTRRFRAVCRLSGRQRLRTLGSLISHISMLAILAGSVVRGWVGQKGHIAFREGESVAAFATHDGPVALPFSVKLVDFEIEYYHREWQPLWQRTIKDWRSALQVVQDGQVVLEKKIEVNDPLRYGGYTFFQSGYDPRDPTWTSLQVVRDPGIPLVYAGFLMMVAGLFLVFCIDPWLDRKQGESQRPETAREERR